MKVGLNTVDLFPGRERLMPFRTVIEIAKAMRMQGIKETYLILMSLLQISPTTFTMVLIFVNALANYTNLANGSTPMNMMCFFSPPHFVKV